MGRKSPLTGTIKETNAGTPFSQSLARLGIKAIVVEGYPRERGKFWILRVTRDGAEFLPADEYVGQGLYTACPALFERFGKKVAIMSIGVAGEMRMAMAGDRLALFPDDMQLRYRWCFVQVGEQNDPR